MFKNPFKKVSGSGNEALIKRFQEAQRLQELKSLEVPKKQDTEVVVVKGNGQQQGVSNTKVEDHREVISLVCDVERIFDDVTSGYELKTTEIEKRYRTEQDTLRRMSLMSQIKIRELGFSVTQNQETGLWSLGIPDELADNTEDIDLAQELIDKRNYILGSLKEIEIENFMREFSTGKGTKTIEDLENLLEELGYSDDGKREVKQRAMRALQSANTTRRIKSNTVKA